MSKIKLSDAPQDSVIRVQAQDIFDYDQVIELQVYNTDPLQAILNNPIDLDADLDVELVED